MRPVQTHTFRRRVPDEGVDLRRDSIALAADWLQVRERIRELVAPRPLLIAERLAALDERRTALSGLRDRG